ncbi:MAG: M28 family peptidase [Paludibacteraceae bacterium]|nr:M28 family peptidase [Paludibacteraceae bacterium]
MKKIFILGFTFLMGVLLFSACSPKQKTLDRPAFCADSAYAYIEKQMSFGPRVPNSKGHNDCAVWLIQKLRSFGAEVELQRGQMPDYRGNMQQIYNIIAHFTPSLKGRDGEGLSRPRILLGAHYDTRPWCDEEENYSDRYYNVPGANDGASGVGVLLEVARQIGQKVADSTLSTPVDIIFFDVEDMGSPRFYTGQEREDTWCLGSQLWATNYAQRSNPQYRFGIVLDMVGAPDASFPKEMYSTQYAGNYQQQIWAAAQKLGYGSMFNNQQSYPITDDHYYVNYIAGIPCVDIIHYDIRNATGFPHWWHTRNDNMDNISKSTLQAVGEVVMSQL